MPCKLFSLCRAEGEACGHFGCFLFPLQVWNAVDSGRCLQTYSLHSEAVRAARWAPCGRRILSGGFDFALHLTDLETGVFLCVAALR